MVAHADEDVDSASDQQRSESVSDQQGLEFSVEKLTKVLDLEMRELQSSLDRPVLGGVAEERRSRVLQLASIEGKFRQLFASLYSSRRDHDLVG